MSEPGAPPAANVDAGTTPDPRPLRSRAAEAAESADASVAADGDRGRLVRADPVDASAVAESGSATAPVVTAGAAAAVDLVAQALDAQMRARAEVRGDAAVEVAPDPAAGRPDEPATPTPVAPTASAPTDVLVTPTPEPAPSPTVAAAPVAAAPSLAASSTHEPATTERVTRGSDDSGDDPFAVLAVGAAASRRPAKRQRRRSSRFWRFGYPVIILAITLCIPLLAWAGKKVVLQSTDGLVLTEITDPAAPGYYSLTTPTPMLLLVQTDDAGVPNGVTVASLTGEGAAGLIFLPMATVLALPDLGNLPLNVVYEKTGLDGLQKAVEGILGVGMSEVRVVSPQQWADLVAPVGPLTFVNPDDVTVPDGRNKRVLFKKGELTLPASDVAAYLSTTSPGENTLNLLVRQKAFWEAWLKKVGASTDPNVVPGETDSGIGRFVRELAEDRVEMFPLPVQTAGIPGSDAHVYVPVADQVAALVARLVPFPIGAPPGARPKVRLLDGTGKLELGLKAAPVVVEGGGQIDQIGNADSFGVATTELVYYDDAMRPLVDKLQAALGVGTITKSTAPASAVDVTVTLGADYLAAPRDVTAVTAVSAGPTTTLTVGVSGG